jgi:hypothetical protein
MDPWDDSVESDLAGPEVLFGRNLPYYASAFLIREIELNFMYSL